MKGRIGVVAVLAVAALVTGCDGAREGALAQPSKSPLSCAAALGETLSDVRTWLGIAADGSQDATVRVVDLSKATAPSVFLLSTGKDLICGSQYSDHVDLATLTDSEQDFLRKGDVVVGGGGSDSLEYVLGGVFRGGPGVDAVGVLNLGLFDGGAGDDQVNDGFPAGTFLGGDGNDIAFGMMSGTYDGGAGTDSVELFYGGTLVNVESCRLDTMDVCP